MARLIDADALRLMKVEECAGHTIDYAAGWKACIDWVRTLPTVDAAPVVHGRWIKKNDQGVFYCSECDLPSLQWWPYCERCGAKMETEISNITKKEFAPSLDDAIKEFNTKWTISGARMDGGEG